MEMDLPQKQYFWGYEYLKTPSRGYISDFISLWISSALEYDPNQTIVLFESYYNKIKEIEGLKESDMLIACATYANIGILVNPYNDTVSEYLISIDKVEKDKVTFVTLSYGNSKSQVVLNMSSQSMTITLTAPTEEVNRESIPDLCSRIDHITKQVNKLKSIWLGWKGDLEIISGSFNPIPKEEFTELIHYYLNYRSNPNFSKLQVNKWYLPPSK